MLPVEAYCDVCACELFLQYSPKSDVVEGNLKLVNMLGSRFSCKRPEKKKMAPKKKLHARESFDAHFGPHKFVAYRL